MGTSISRRLFIGGAGTLLPAMQGKRLLAGVYATNITPALGNSIAGSMRNGIAEEIHDELHARCLVLDNGTNKIAFVVADSCAIAGEVIRHAKQLIWQHTEIPPHRVLISATHSHSAPAAARLFQSDPDPRYQDFLAVRISDAVRLALRRLEPARIGWGTGREDRLLFNRRFFMKPGTIPADPFGRTTDQVLMNPGVGNPNVLKPAGPIDPDVNLLGVVAEDGRPLCAFGSYALHYVGAPGRTISADYFSVWADEMKIRLGAGPGFLGILANACSGNVNNVKVIGGEPRTYPPFAKITEAAKMLADEAARVWKKLEFKDWVELDASLEEIDLGVRKPSAADIAEAREILKGAPPELVDRRQIYARETLQVATYAPFVKAPVQAIRIGSLGIATFPGEAFTELGLEVKQRSPFKPTFFIELANGYLGYIPTVEGHRLGGYETWRAKSSFLEVEAAPKMVEAALRGLRKLS